MPRVLWGHGPQRALRHAGDAHRSEDVARAHPRGTPLTGDVAVVAIDADAEARWRAWQARGAASDRRTALRMKVLLLVVVAALVLWVLVVA